MKRVSMLILVALVASGCSELELDELSFACLVDADCAAGWSCADGVCVEAGTDSAAACTDTSSDPENCGSCGRSCGEGMLCVNGQCECPSDLVQCLDACFDHDELPEACRPPCSVECVGGQLCIEGQCRCADAQSLCDGRCVDTESSFDHCGGCGKACASEQHCWAGACVALGGTGVACTQARQCASRVCCLSNDAGVCAEDCLGQPLVCGSDDDCLNSAQRHCCPSGALLTCQADPC